MVRRAAAALALLAALAHAAVVEELRFVADATALAAAEGGVVVVGLFGEGDAAEKRGFMAAAKSREFEDEGWAVAWSGTPKVVAYFDVPTPAMLVCGRRRLFLPRVRARAPVGERSEPRARSRYRLFDADGAPCDPRPEAYNATMGGGWGYRALKSFVFAVSFKPLSTFPVPPAPKALAEPLDDSVVPEDDYDDLETKRRENLAAFVTRRAKENYRLQAALKQSTVPKLVVYMHDEAYFDDHADEGAAPASSRERPLSPEDFFFFSQAPRCSNSRSGRSAASSSSR